MEKSRPALLELFTSYLGSGKMGEMERKLQRGQLGLGLGVPVPCVARVPACWLCQLGWRELCPALRALFSVQPGGTGDEALGNGKALM